MPPSCCALNCKNGYGNSKMPAGVSAHKFPLKNEDLLRKWLINLGRRDFLPSVSSCICSLHFKDDDFKQESSDTNVSRKRRRSKKGDVFKRPQLKPTAVPTIFGKSVEKKSKVLENKNVKRIIMRRMIKQEEEQNGHDSALVTTDSQQSNNVDEIDSALKTNNESIVQEFQIWKRTGTLFICYIQVDEARMPVIKGSIVIGENLNVHIFVEGKSFNPEMYQRIASNGKVNSLEQVLNLMDFIKNRIRNVMKPNIVRSKIKRKRKP